MEFTVQEVASLLNGEIEGEAKAKVSTISKIQEAEDGSISFLANLKYEKYLYETRATAVIVNKDYQLKKPVSSTLIRVDDAYLAFSALLEEYQRLIALGKIGKEEPCFVSETATIGASPYIGAFAYIGQNVSIGDHCKIYPQVYIGDDVQIGDHTVIYPGSKVMNNCVVGNYCTLQPGVVIGSDGFGFAPQPDGSYKTIPQVGNVVLEDHVDIGAGCTIDRGVTGSTTIGRGSKLDNQIQVGHDTVIGKKCLIASHVGIAGCCIIKDEVTLWGQVGITSGATIGKKAVILAQSGISKSLEGGKTYFGYPAEEAREKLKQIASIKRIPEILQKLKKI